MSIPLHYTRINDLEIAEIAGDTSSAIGARIQSSPVSKSTMVMTLMAGSIAYILPDEAYLKPGHGVGSSPLKQGCAQPAMIAAFHKLEKQQP